MTGAELDLSRLAELPELLGRELAEIVDTLVGELTRAFGEISAGLAADDLEKVAGGAHSARNSALMIDALPLLGGLAELEACARRADLPAARRAHARLQELWPPLRRRLRVAAKTA